MLSPLCYFDAPSSIVACHPGFLRQHAYRDATITVRLFFLLSSNSILFALFRSLTTHSLSGLFYAKWPFSLPVYAFSFITPDPNWSSTCPLSPILQSLPATSVAASTPSLFTSKLFLTFLTRFGYHWYSTHGNHDVSCLIFQRKR